MCEEVKEEKKIRKLNELSLIDNYLFGLFIENVNDNDIIKEMLERMLDIKIKKIVLKQQQYEIFNEPGSRSVRLDAYLGDDENTLYNIEVQIKNTGNIPKRIRYNRSLIDKDQLASGEKDFNELPKSIIIFINNFDLFNKGLYRYTFKNICVEDNSIELGDDSLTVILNTKGKKKEGVSQKLVDLLEYFTSSNEKTVTKTSDEFLKNVDERLTPIKNNRKFGDDFVQFQIYLNEEKRESKEEGRQEGIQEGIEIGKEEGIEIGEAKGVEKERQATIERLRKMGMTDEDIEKFYA